MVLRYFVRLLYVCFTIPIALPSLPHSPKSSYIPILHTFPLHPVTYYRYSKFNAFHTLTLPFIPLTSIIKDAITLLFRYAISHSQTHMRSYPILCTGYSYTDPNPIFSYSHNYKLLSCYTVTPVPLHKSLLSTSLPRCYPYPSHNLNLFQHTPTSSLSPPVYAFSPLATHFLYPCSANFPILLLLPLHSPSLPSRRQRKIQGVVCCREGEQCKFRGAAVQISDPD